MKIRLFCLGLLFLLSNVANSQELPGNPLSGCIGAIHTLFYDDKQDTYYLYGTGGYKEWFL
ncbi:hypothetical protein [Sphingobacterium daejeonense]|uniref:hypothetical protein n=1 Tax=Sphingobacterium daejeonense TaxID=371142 RepID=UPI0010C4539C|nr:hypothetical protein [Sphingobacterium daejeonense]VTQ06955.1 Uncharacterised protein [Sphingobacterium daejeonense]